MNGFYVLGLIQAFGIGSGVMAIVLNYNTDSAITGLILLAISIINNVICYKSNK